MRARDVRGASGGEGGSGGGGVRGAESELRRAEPESQSGSALSARAGRRAGGAGRVVPGAECGTGGGFIGDREGGGSVCAAGSGVSGRTAGLHGGGCAGAGGGDDGRCTEEDTGGVGADGMPGQRLGPDRHLQWEEPRADQRWGERGLSYIYVRFDGISQGRSGHTCRFGLLNQRKVALLSRFRT